MIEVRLAKFPSDADAVLEIWREFIATVPADLSYQGNEEEFAHLPGKYAEPFGRIILALQDEKLIGCVSLRKVSSEICEMKRLYVRSAARGLSVGQMLAERAVREAKSIGYAEMRLDVMPNYGEARGLYKKMGFVPAEPVSHNPVPGASFLGLTLA
jgi:ribosomal protein S18 acetylase RimI-like enzyme